MWQFGFIGNNNLGLWVVLYKIESLVTYLFNRILDQKDIAFVLFVNEHVWCGITKQVPRNNG
jgi:hypothetical protein